MLAGNAIVAAAVIDAWEDVRHNITALFECERHTLGQCGYATKTYSPRF